MTWGEEGDWEAEMRWQRARLRGEGFTPYEEMRAWRRRFWRLLLAMAGLVALFVAVAR